ncbi:hypothetical protein XppCFBP6982P_01715 [Xanthomonas phaseoli pv. phaseoli]|nr:hypothetical protein [Xanthomonas phaseoli]ATS32786.1 hypothetical protein XppCFBP6982P_01715 [Xanthomonas phaseoli pv. phaseoli]KHD60827.1 hypothetical protein PK63_19420 [Xanthomonas phaseoli pv. phaseoli]UZB19105.1 hypothetical protein OM947_12815 [Xanthomonas phaseoli pv. phaseoli]
MALDIVRRAFFPLHCGAEIYDYDDMMRINVVNDAEESMLKLPAISKDEFTDSDRLGVLLHRLRDDLSHHMGFQLEPWQMPDIKLLAT